MDKKELDKLNIQFSPDFMCSLMERENSEYYSANIEKLAKKIKISRNIQLKSAISFSNI